MFALVFSLSSCSNKKRGMTTEEGTVPSNASIIDESILGTPAVTDPNANASPLNSVIQPVIDPEQYTGSAGPTQSSGGKAIVGSVGEFVSSAVNSTSAIMSYLIGPGDSNSAWDIQIQEVPQ